ncbi:DeoR/GlpR transcriptional regulator [Frigoribacterium sp. ACAM 257]|uniref:DeoR/GlpR family DNA-binding transcription regulator n=1 Tax=Frigoribacterium sp. ACAM 257 TaxID=2508998 RepID=UPI0011B99C12|nr:DeoR/GlpR family DNA-binding transcription regulator [Frigoribacterium sp. ACAM 257]TWX38783.1 DeoR/GlpR transcriptional regulator [Frigoribacterium sp. ACAM 257]
MTRNPDAAPLPGERRRGRIADLVGRRGFVSTAELAREFRLSEVTIRTDLESLAAEGLLSRVHGGALSVDRPVERPFEEESAVGTDAKKAIGVRAASLVRSGDCVVIDVGTTTTQIALALLDRHDLEGVVVVTNGLTIALALEQAVPRFTVIVSGGTLRPLQHSLVNPLATSVFSSITADLAFIGCTGVHAEHGATNVNLPETDLKRLMTQTARRSYIVADGGKLGEAHLGVIGPLDRFEALITADADAGQVDALRRAGLEVVEAELPDDGPGPDGADDDLAG